MEEIKRFETHSHTHFSNIRLIDAINKPKELILTAYKKGYSGIAITDHEFVGNFIYVLDAEKELKETGEIPEDFKVALGNEIYLVNNRNKEEIEKYFHFLLIAKDTLGHEALRKMSSNSWCNAYVDKRMWRVPTTKRELKKIVDEYKGHLIADSACFLSGMKVITLSGEKNIEDITSEDFILNKDGCWEKVNYPTSRFYEGKGRKITFYNNGENVIRCTENHQFLVSSENWKKTKEPFRWVEAKELKDKGCGKKYCLFPIVPNYTYQNVIYRKDWEKTIRKISYTPKYILPDEIKITPAIMRLFGLWLGDGSISITERSKRISFTFSEEEYSCYWDSFVRQASEELNIRWYVHEDKKHHKIELSSSSIELIELFYYLFGLSHAEEKYVPNRLKHISEELDWNLFYGYALADGYFRDRSKGKGKIALNSGEFVAVSISKRLILDMKELLQSLGIRSSYQEVEERTDKNGVHHCKSYYLSSSNSAWKEIKKKEVKQNIDDILKKAQQYDEKKHIVYNGIKYKKVYIKQNEEINISERVYCLNDDSHSFCCENIIVHNCIGNEIYYAMCNKDGRRIDDFINYCLELFGEDFYIEIAPGFSEEQIKYNKFIKQVARKYNIKMVIGCDAHYYTKEDRFVHKSFLLSKEGARETDDFYAYTYLMDNNEVYENIPYYTREELNQCFLNSIEIRNKISNYNVYHGQVIPQENVKNYEKFSAKNIITADKYPTFRKFLDDDNIQNRYWANECYNALVKKGLDNETYFKRIETEADILDTISKKLNVTMTSYHNTLQQYIDLMWNCGCVLGPGRGSACGFLSNYCLGITQLDPIVENLAEWRYLNKERVELGDIDLDLNPSGRKKVLGKIRERKGGETRVLQVATFGTITTKSAILTACRGYRLQDEEGEELYPDGINVDDALYMTSLIEQERGFLWSLEDCFYGNEDKDRKPNEALIKEVSKYPRLKEIIFAINGLIDKRGTHASGVIIYDKSPYYTNAVMRAPDGSLTTQMDLHKSEEAGDLKYDFLVTDMCDRIKTTLELLRDGGIVEKDYSLRQLYNKYLHPSVIDIKDKKIWEALGNNSVINVFQFSSGVGLETAMLIKPKTPAEMTCCNGLLRLTAEKGKERPLSKYKRYRDNISLWYKEMDSYGLSKDQEKLLEPYLLIDYGVTPYQESMMRVLMDKDIANFSLAEANSARKICAKVLVP